MALEINRTMRLTQSDYFDVKSNKTGICVHHTVGGSALSTFNWWSTDKQMVGTAYIIDRDGKLYEVFDPECWAWQFGLSWDHAEKIAFEKRFIGIEIASEGGLIQREGKFYCYDRVSERTQKKPDEVFDAGRDYRGYRYFDKYEPAQIDTLISVANELFDRFNIPRRVKADSTKYYGEQLKDFEGIIGHVMVRQDKTDPAPMPELWQRLRDECHLQIDDDGESQDQPVVNEENESASQDLDKLFDSNMVELNKMNVSAGSMVKGLIMELERDNRNTYIRLHDAVSGGHIIHYDLVKGDPNLVKRIGGALGFAKVTDHDLEVHHA